MSAALKPPAHMTVAEFLAWDPEDGTGALWQLRNGEPEMMAPTTENHGAIQGELFRLIGNHLLESGSRCRAIITPGVVPRVRADRNALIPDLAVTCAPPSSVRLMREPVLIVEVMSLSNEAETRANVWAYSTIPSVQEVLILFSTQVGAEMLRRQPDGTWPELPGFLAGADPLRMDSVGLVVPLQGVYRTTSLV